MSLPELSSPACPSPPSVCPSLQLTNLLVTGNDSSVTLWNTRTWKAVRSLSETRGPCLFSPDGQWLLTGWRESFECGTPTWQSLGDCDNAPSLAFQTRYALLLRRTAASWSRALEKVSAIIFASGGCRAWKGCRILGYRTRSLLRWRFLLMANIFSLDFAPEN